MFVVTTLAKLGAGVLVVVGGGCVTSVALWKTGYIGTNNAEGSSSVGTQPLQDSHVQATQSDTSLNSDGFWQTRSGTPTRTTEVPKDNCTVLKNDSFNNIIQGLTNSDEGYTVISCSNEGSSFKTNWTGFFSSDLIEEHIVAGEKQTVVVNQQDIEEETETDDFDANYRTTFIGKVFDGGSLTGDWGNSTKKIDEKNLTIFRTEDEKEFYLLFDSQEN